jgi:hypothetical protein
MNTKISYGNKRHREDQDCEGPHFDDILLAALLC